MGWGAFGAILVVLVVGSFVHKALCCVVGVIDAWREHRCDKKEGSAL